jgi:small basic protein
MSDSYGIFDHKDYSFGDIDKRLGENKGEDVIMKKLWDNDIFIVLAFIFGMVLYLCLLYLSFWLGLHCK